MKKWFAIIIVLIIANGVRADLVIQKRVSGDTVTNVVTVSVRENMLREESGSESFGRMVQIVDMSTFDQTILSPANKTFTKKSGGKIKEYLKKQESPENSLPTSTGNFESIGKFETEIFFWSNGKNTTNRLWVAKNYPKFEAIKPYLVKLDEYHKQGLDRFVQPSVAELPGMVIKRIEVRGNQKIVTELISASVQPVGAALFEIPEDFSEFKPQTKRSE